MGVRYVLEGSVLKADDQLRIYSELRKTAEARTEAAEVLRINPQFSLDVHKQRVPTAGRRPACSWPACGLNSNHTRSPGSGA
jgi:hypothetical protein